MVQMVCTYESKGGNAYATHGVALFSTGRYETKVTTIQSATLKHDASFTLL